MGSITVTNFIQRANTNIGVVYGGLIGSERDTFTFNALYYSTVSDEGPWVGITPIFTDPYYMWPGIGADSPGASYRLPVELPESADGRVWFKAEADFVEAITPLAGSIITINPFFYQSIIQGNWGFYKNSSHIRNGVLYNSTHNQNDSVTYQEYMEPGTYNFIMTGMKGSAGGIVQVELDGNTVQFDLYEAAWILDQLFTTTMTITTRGIKTITVTVVDKNPLSSNHYTYISDIILYRAT